MRALSHLFFKIALSSMIASAPAMINGNKTESGYGSSTGHEKLPYYSVDVIKKYVGSARYSPLFPQTMIEMSPVGLERILAKRIELRSVVSRAATLYDSIGLQRFGLDEEAFAYAWRGYHNLLKRGLIHRKNVLSICDFSQSSSHKRMYVIDILHKKLLYRTYVAHGQNSGSEYADSFSNQPESFKSSLGFYLTSRTYFGRNGLSLKIQGMDTGFNDLAGKRNIVLHGCTYASQAHLLHYGSLGTSLGCPAIPAAISSRIIRTVEHGSCLFIYHPSKKYLEASPILNG